MIHPHKPQVYLPVSSLFRNEFALAFERDPTNIAIAVQVAMFIRWFNMAEDTGQARARVLLNMKVDPFGEGPPLEEAIYLE
jgi:hypothetical protein